MKSFLHFLKQVLAATLGVAVFYIFFFSFFLGYLPYQISRNLASANQVVKHNTILRIPLQGEIVEHISDFPVNKRLLSLSEMSNILKAASEDPKIQGIYLEIDYLSGSLDSIDALRQIFQKYKEASQKPIAIYAKHYNEASLALASVADHIILHPGGMVMFKGLSIKGFFYKRLLGRFGIESMLFTAGKYKVSSFPYVSDHMSNHDKEEWKKILGVKYEFLVEKITSSRPVRPLDLDDIIKNKPFLTPEQACKYHLIDEVGFSDSANAFFNKQLKESENLLFQESSEDIPLPEQKEDDVSLNPEIGLLPGEDYQKERPNYILYKFYKPFVKSFYDRRMDQVGIIPLEGTIVSKGNEPHRISEERVIPLLEQYAKNDKIKAIVIIMNSSGGGAMPSATIAHTIEQIKKYKPVVCLVRGGALSGGLYIAASCSKIIAASPGTPIGSIGVWSMGLNLKKAAEKHLFIDVDGVKTHPHADIYSDSFHEYSDKEKELIQSSVNHVYNCFKSHIKRCRKFTKEEIHRVDEGRIFVASEACKLKLIDEVAPTKSLDRAIQLSLQLAGIEEQEVQLIYPESTTNIEHLGHLIVSFFNKQFNNLLHGDKMYQAPYTLRRESESF